MARTPRAYTLVDLGCYPGLLAGGITAVRGEIYSVDAHTLARLDALEDHPDVYVRSPLELPRWPDVEVYLIRPEYAKNAPTVASGIWPPRARLSGHRRASP